MRRTIAERLPQIQAELRNRRMVLRERLRALGQDLAEVTASQEQEGTIATHQADEASDLLAAETDLLAIREMQAELRDITETLDRIEAGTWGICEDCGGEIDPARLEALPTATRCLRCETRFELESARHTRAERP